LSFNNGITVFYIDAIYGSNSAGSNISGTSGSNSARSRDGSDEGSLFGSTGFELSLIVLIGFYFIKNK